MTKFKGGERLPGGVTTEDIARDGWSFIKIRDGEPVVAPKSKLVAAGEEK